jgi:16S rRNA (adenine1518-N6/adenine1519-N6)-dimethyltransferase
MGLKQNIKNLLKEYQIYPSKRFGQNFLIEKSVLKKILRAAKIKNTDRVLEIGPGLGLLTKELEKRAKSVIAIEKDKKMIEILKTIFKEKENVKIISSDILKISERKLASLGKYKVVANLPYYIALKTIIKFLRTKNPPELMVVMVQKEVAQRICAKKESLPSLAVKFYARPKILFFVSKDSFWPKPKVDGAVLKIEKIKKRKQEDLFFKLTKAGFLYPRKTILNNLSAGLKIEKEKIKPWLLACGISPKKRPENIDFSDWLKLLKNYDIINQWEKN